MKNKGITLIALVITIIVLIILAGVSINLLLGDNGLINKAKETVVITEIARIKEETELLRLGLDMDYFSNIENVEKLKKATLLSEINNHFEGSTKEGNRVTTSDGKYDIIVRNNLEILVVKHNKSYLKDGEIELDYYYDETEATSVYIEIYPVVGGIPTYEEYAVEILEGKDNEYKEMLFVEADKYYMISNGEELTEEELAITEFKEWMEVCATKGAFGDATDIPEDIVEFNQWLTNGTETIDEMLIGMEYVNPEGYYGKSYGKYAQEILDNITQTGEARDAILEEYFIEADKYWGNCSEEGMEVTDFVEYMQNDYGGFGFAEGEEPTTLEELRIWANTNWEETYETVEEMLILWECIDPEGYGEYLDELDNSRNIKIECSNGTTKYAYVGDYAEFEVTENGTYTFTAIGPNGETGDVTIEINNLKYDISLSTISNTIEKGATFNITATTKSTKDLIWTSSDETIATVDGSSDGKKIGIVTGKKQGTVTITVQNEESITKTCEIRVFSTEYGVIEVKFMKNNTYTTSDTANAPKVDEVNGMKLVKFDTATSSWVEGTEYSYVAGTGTADNTSSKWANAKVTVDGIDSYFVWIPRYAYKITYFDTIEHRDAYRADKTQTEGIIGYSDSRGMVDATGKIIEGVASSTSTNVGDYYMVHPAFTLDASVGGGFGELKGLWIGKYEASRSDAKIDRVGTSTTLKVAPSVKNWRFITIGNAYTYAKEYNTNLNSHMLKNSEWGAVAYLTESQYGRNGNEIGVNQCSGFITGAGPGEGDSNIYNTTYDYNSSDFETTYSYTSTQGKKASTTGNEYGIYDISGGANEYVASYYNKSYSSNYTDGSSFSSNGKTSNKYSISYTGTTAKSNYIKGDATYETNGWNYDMHTFVYYVAPYFGRGGDFNAAKWRGAYYFCGNGGGIDGNTSFRVCLAVE